MTRNQRLGLALMRDDLRHCPFSFFPLLLFSSVLPPFGLLAAVIMPFHPFLESVVVRRVHQYLPVSASVRVWVTWIEYVLAFPLLFMFVQAILFALFVGSAIQGLLLGILALGFSALAWLVKVRSRFVCPAGMPGGNKKAEYSWLVLFALTGCLPLLLLKTRFSWDILVSIPGLAFAALALGLFGVSCVSAKRLAGTNPPPATPLFNPRPEKREEGTVVLPDLSLRGLPSLWVDHAGIGLLALLCLMVPYFLLRVESLDEELTKLMAGSGLLLFGVATSTLVRGNMIRCLRTLPLSQFRLALFLAGGPLVTFLVIMLPMTLVFCVFPWPTSTALGILVWSLVPLGAGLFAGSAVLACGFYGALPVVIGCSMLVFGLFGLPYLRDLRHGADIMVPLSPIPALVLAGLLGAIGVCVLHDALVNARTYRVKPSSDAWR